MTAAPTRLAAASSRRCLRARRPTRSSACTTRSSSTGRKWELGLSGSGPKRECAGAARHATTLRLSWSARCARATQAHPTRRAPTAWRGRGHTGRYAGEKNFVDFEGDHNSRRPKFFHVRRAAGRAGGRAGLRRARVPTLKWAGDTCHAARARTRVVQHATPEASGLPLAQPLARDSMRLRPHAQRSPPPHRAAQRTGPFAVWFDLVVCLFVCLGLLVVYCFMLVCGCLFVCLFVVCVFLFVCCLRLVRCSCCKLRGRLRVTARCVCRTRPRSFC